MSSRIWPYETPMQKTVRNPVWTMCQAGDKVYSKIDNRVVRHVFGMPTKTTSDIVRGRIDLARKRMQTDYEQPSTLDPAATGLRANEEVSLGKPFDDDLVDSFQAKYEAEIQKDEWAVRGAKRDNVPKKYDDRIFSRQIPFMSERVPESPDPYEIFPEIEGIIDEVSDIVKQYYGTHYVITQGRVYRTYPVPEELLEYSEAYANYWHCDGSPTDYIKVFVLLNDVDDTNGPFTYLDRETTKDLAGDLYRYQNGLPNSFVEDTVDDVKTFTGEAGTAMFCNTNKILHRAGIPEEGKHRDLLLIQFKPSAEPASRDEHFLGR